MKYEVFSTTRVSIFDLPFEAKRTTQERTSKVVSSPTVLQKPRKAHQPLSKPAQNHSSPSSIPITKHLHYFPLNKSFCPPSHLAILAVLLLQLLPKTPHPNRTSPASAPPAVHPEHLAPRVPADHALRGRGGDRRVPSALRGHGRRWLGLPGYVSWLRKVVDEANKDGSSHYLWKAYLCGFCRSISWYAHLHKYTWFNPDLKICDNEQLRYKI